MAACAHGVNTDDTIVAVATPPGEGGIGIVRLSGPQSRAIAGQFFRTRHGHAVPWAPRRLYFGRVVDPDDGRVVDDAMACYLAAPRSFTGDDTVEIQAHGSPVALRSIVALCLAAGARLARRGEFTLRAFLNGRLDLTQAEAVLDVVQARTQGALSLAVAQMGGALTRRLQAPTDALLGALAHMEALIDFVDDGIPAAQEALITARLDAALADLGALLDTASTGMILREGLRAVLAGKPNVGKSSLLNALLRVERAIVTPIAGTTRDTVEEPVAIGDVPVYLVDTAGLTDTDDMVERIGVERSHRALASAALVVFVLDGSHVPDAADRAVAAILGALAHTPPIVIALNKDDMPPAMTEDEARALLEHHGRPLAVVSCSAIRPGGLDALEAAITTVVLDPTARAALDDGDGILDRARHKEAVSAAVAGAERAVRGLRGGDVPLELLCVDLRGALAHLGEITGRTDVGEEVLDRIFRDFCIGK